MLIVNEPFHFKYDIINYYTNIPNYFILYLYYYYVTIFIYDNNIEGLDHWVTSSYHNMWIVEKLPLGAPPLPDDPDFDGQTSCFVSTYRQCSKHQKIIFKHYGLNSTVMKFLHPEIFVSEW